MRYALIAIPLFAARLLSAQAPTYQITHTYPLGGDGSWDYLVPDPARRRPPMVPGSFVVLVVERR